MPKKKTATICVPGDVTPQNAVEVKDSILECVSGLLKGSDVTITSDDTDISVLSQQLAYALHKALVRDGRSAELSEAYDALLPDPKLQE